MRILQEKILNFDLKSYIKTLLKKTDTLFVLSFLVSFIALNIIFTYHSTYFMFGDHDWKYLKNGIPLNSGLFEGRFTQFIFINLFSYGEILPFINNMLGFLGFSIGISLLAKYWDITRTKSTYILFALFSTLTPYILSFMYFSFLVIPCLSWNAIVILSLIICSKQTSFSLIKTITSALLFTFALGGYPPIINLYAVALCTKLFLTSFYENTSVKKLIFNYRYSIINFLIGAILYKLVLMYFTHTGAINENYYNLQTIPFSEWPNKFILISKDILKQFTTTLPFITNPYRLLTLSITILATMQLLLKTIKYKSISCLTYIILFIGIFYSAMITLFLSPSVAETEFSPRIDFFGLLYVYSAMLAIIFKSSNLTLKNISSLLVSLTIIFNTNTLFEAQKVWKLGFDAELKLYKRAEKRFKSSPIFNPYHKYIMVQAGSPSLRHRFYHTPYKHNSDDLLSISYVPAMNSGVMFNYYSHPEYITPTSYVYIFSPDDQAKQFISQAAPWPSKNSTMVGNYWIMLIMDKNSLETLKKRYLQ